MTFLPGSSEFVFWVQSSPMNLENYTLILPSISVGNVGQLAVDLLLNNLNVKKAAYVNHPSIIPMVGADPFKSECLELTTSCQLYVCEENKIAIIQHRAPLVTAKIPSYITFLASFIKDQKVKRTILLASSFSEFFTFDDLKGVPIHYLTATCDADTDDAFKAFGWKKFALPSNVESSEFSTIPGGGIAKLFIEKCEKEAIPLVALILICSEGNNYPEAFRTIECLNKWLLLKEDMAAGKWQTPFSWKLPYGSAAPKTLY
ncbi:proteasome assembly chaperone 2 [Trichonephila inaurata madagascariensis]|uniref:Proteasome assembly chaperone 2 n=1 Tax=Trichonephila inaurata madagascariensis TaxID=2747483 RepID=A0A8X7CLT5_9ARAC|nr:proteasome assembly chaperone 2 [Trichonephila inaurata madagascariensis]